MPGRPVALCAVPAVISFDLQAVPRRMIGTYDIAFESGEHLAGSFNVLGCD